MLGLPHSTPEEAVEAYAKAVYELGVAVGIKMNFKVKESMKKLGKTACMKLPCLLMKTNVHLLTHAFQWLTICKKSSKMLTMVTKKDQDVLNN